MPSRTRRPPWDLRTPPPPPQPKTDTVNFEAGNDMMDALAEDEAPQAAPELTEAQRALFATFDFNCELPPSGSAVMKSKVMPSA